MGGYQSCDPSVVERQDAQNLTSSVKNQLEVRLIRIQSGYSIPIFFDMLKNVLKPFALHKYKVKKKYNLRYKKSG